MLQQKSDKEDNHGILGDPIAKSGDRAEDSLGRICIPDESNADSRLNRYVIHWVHTQPCGQNMRYVGFSFVF